MFSPEPAADAAASIRNNPRRRRRHDTDSIAQRQPRKRSRLASDNHTASVNGTSSLARSTKGNKFSDAKAVVNGSAVNGHLPEELTFREKREVNGSTQRAVKDASPILTKNQKFTINTLPALPEKLRKVPDGALRVSFHSRQSTTYAVATTQDAIYIWDCNTSTTSPTARSISLPYPAKTQEQLPLACLINSAGKELGLVLAYPTTGSITFWEDVDSAESLKLFEQRRYGVEGFLKLLSHEVIEEISDAGSAGLILLTSAGRLAQLTLQDSYGQPHIGVAIFSGSIKTSFFGGLTQVFSSTWKNRLNSVKLRHISKGRFEVVALSGDGVFKIWEVREAAQNDHIGDIHSELDVREALQQAGLLDSTIRSSLKFISLAIHSETSTDLVQYGDGTSAPIDVYVLVQMNSSNRAQYVLLDIRLGEARANVLRIFPIQVLEPSMKGESQTQLWLTSPSHTALITDEKSAVIISIPPRKSSTDDKIGSGEVAELPSFYQDTILLDNARGTRFTAVAVEPSLKSSKHQKRADANVLCFLNPARVLRIVCSNFNDKGASSRFRLPSAQSKIEQAILFGTGSDHLLNLHDLAKFDYSGAEIEEAALAISANIVTTASDHLQQSAASMEQHIVMRIKALQDLSTFLRQYCRPLSRSARWKLLSDAERLASARALWQSHDRRIADKSRQHVSLLEEAIDTALERYKDDKDAKHDQVDDVRLFFTRKLNMLEKLLPLCFGLIKARHKNGALSTDDFLRLAPEMNEIIVTVLDTAYQYRQRQASQYALDQDDLEDGLLTVGYEDLDRFWTSSDDVIKAMGWSIKLTHDVVSTIIGSGAEGPHLDDAEAISATMEAVIRLSCRSHIEAYRWLLSQSDDASRQKGQEMKSAFESQIRRNQIGYLYDMGQVQRGLILAEDLEDIPALVDLALRESDYQKGAYQRSGTSKSQKMRDRPSGLEAIEEQIKHFFRKFGQEFAEAFYANQVATHRLGDLIDKDLGNNELRTQFLRSDPGNSKISWINEILNEDDLLQASKDLMQVAQTRESNTWSKKVELSLSKLALLTLPAAQGTDNDSNGDRVDIAHVSKVDEMELEILDIQRRLDSTIRSATVDALDEEAKLHNVIATFGNSLAKTHPSLTQLLKLGFSELISQRVMGIESLIDVLTLIDLPSSTGEESDLMVERDQYYLALKALKAAASSSLVSDTEENMLKRLIWKRCIVSQDWNEFGRTTDLSDSDVQEALRETAVFYTIKHGVKEAFFTAPLDAEIPLPSTVVGAGSHADDFARRFASEDLRGPIAADNGRDDTTLKEYLENAHLDDIWGNIKELAIMSQEEDAQAESDKQLRYDVFVAQKDEEEALDYELEEDQEGDEAEAVDEDFIKEEEIDENDVVQGIEGAEDGDIVMGD